MMRAHPGQSRHESDPAEDGKENDDSIEAAALPVAAAKMQPHAKLIEGKRHAEAVENGAEFAHCIGSVCVKNQESADGRKNEDAVVQVMNVRAVRVQEHVRDATRHDENDQYARGDESEKETEKHTPAQEADRERFGGGSDHGRS